MDSQQLLNALHTAQRQAGGRPTKVRLINSHGDSYASYEVASVTYHADARHQGAVIPKPEIHIKFA